MNGSELFSRIEGHRATDQTQQATKHVAMRDPPKAERQERGKLHPQNRIPGWGQLLKDMSAGKPKHSQPNLQAVERETNCP